MVVHPLDFKKGCLSSIENCFVSQQHLIEEVPTHEETPFLEDGQDPYRMHFIQMWLALPDEWEDPLPSFEHQLVSSLPIYQKSQANARIAMGALWGKDSTNHLRRKYFL